MSPRRPAIGVATEAASKYVVKIHATPVGVVCKSSCSVGKRRHDERLEHRVGAAADSEHCEHESGTWCRPGGNLRSHPANLPAAGATACTQRRRIDARPAPDDSQLALNSRVHDAGSNNEIGSSDGQDDDDPSPQTGESPGTPPSRGFRNFCLSQTPLQVVSAQRRRPYDRRAWTTSHRAAADGPAVTRIALVTGAGSGIGTRGRRRARRRRASRSSSPADASSTLEATAAAAGNDAIADRPATSRDPASVAVAVRRDRRALRPARPALQQRRHRRPGRPARGPRPSSSGGRSSTPTSPARSSARRRRSG